MDKRFQKINQLLSAYSLGNFDTKLPMSRRMDEVDAFISGVNMLGEELKDRTISRDYFNNIFNSVSDMVFVLDRQGRIENVNSAVTDNLHYDLRLLKGKPIAFLLNRNEPGWMNKLIRSTRRSNKMDHETVFRTKEKNTVPVLVSASNLIGKNLKGKLLVTAKDISIQKQAENAILKAIMETEERERSRFAKDIHDSIGQQLSAIKFYIGTSADAVEDSKQKDILLRANAALVNVQADMRNICFNIMPISLEIFGLVKAVEELCSKNELLASMKISIRESNNFPRLPLQQEFAMFRIIQEFINNSLKHSKATALNIEFSYRKGLCMVILSDNGIGFNTTAQKYKGMGLNNVRSRIRPYNGEVEISSIPGKGTCYEITIPLETKR